MEIIDAEDEDAKKVINLAELEDLIECDTELKFNDPVLSSFPLFDTPPSSSHSNSIPSSPSSISTDSTSSSKRTRLSKNYHEEPFKDLPFELSQTTDDDDDNDDDFDLSKEKQRYKNKRNKLNSSISNISTSNNSSSNNTNSNERTSALSLKDPMMMSASHSPSHFSSDLSSYMDQMFFSSSQYLSPGLAADDTIDLCTILKTESALGYDNDMIMIG